MKKVYTFVTIAMLAGLAQAASDFNITVTNGIKVLPRRGSVATEVCAVSSNYVQGKQVLNGSVTYMALNAGTTGVASTSFPTHSNGAVTPTGSSIRWLAVENDPRKAIMIQQNLTTGSVYVTRGYSAGIGTGTEVRATGTYNDKSCWQGEVYVNATNATINVSDW